MAIGEYRTNFNEPGICPRCLGPLPLGYPGALSRADGLTEICSQCGTEEGLSDFADNGLFGSKADPATDWPLNDRASGVMLDPVDGSRRFGRVVQ